MVACEYQGLNWKGGGNSGHQSIDGLRRDCEKFTEASLSGWTLILITAETVNNGQAVEWAVPPGHVRAEFGGQPWDVGRRGADGCPRSKPRRQSEY